MEFNQSLLAQGDVPQLLHQSERTKIVRQNQLDGTVAVYKTTIGFEAARRAAHERSILQLLKGVEGVIGLSNDTSNDVCTTVLRSIDGVDLATVIALESDDFTEQRLDIAKVIEIAIGLAEIIARVHQRGVAHRDINPSNVIFSFNTNAIELIDFELATTAALERPSFTHESAIVGTLAYIAPEQTGRTSRTIDHRADLYSLGATFYQMATGRTVFVGNDALSLIHAHLAQVPIPAIEINPDLPPVFSHIIQKLLEKDPDRRYQSAEGLVYDLRHMKEDLQKDFELGKRDFPLRLSPPSRLVGRDQEIATLQSAFQNSIAGTTHALFITGLPGVGKTALADELRADVTKVGGVFITGKFDQYRQDLSSDALCQALRAYGRLLLAEPEQTIVRLREQLRKVLGSNIGLIAALLPEFGVLLDAPQDLTVDDLGKAGERIAQAISCLVRTIASPSRPVVMVIDDLQWASPSSIDVIDALLLDGDIKGLLLVGAYRLTEVDAAHPLTTMMSRWNHLGVAPNMLHLENLTSGDLCLLLAEMLRLPSEKTVDITDVIAERTAGNPYDTTELINALRSEGVLVPSAEGWKWDAQTIRRFVGKGDVVDRLLARINALPKATADSLKTLSCLGGSIAVETLGTTIGCDDNEVDSLLLPALEDGLLVLERDQHEIKICFRHDRVQQAAYSALNEEQRLTIHLQMARRLRHSAADYSLVAEQYLICFEEIGGDEERRFVASLFRDTAKGLQIVNMTMAGRLLSAARQLADDIENVIEPDASLRDSLKEEHHTILYGLGRHDEVDALYELIEQRIDDPIRFANSASLQIASLSQRGRFADAIAIASDQLARLGLDKVTDFREAAIQRIDDLYTWVAEDQIADEIAAQEISDPRVIALIKIITAVLPAVMSTNQTMMAWLLLEGHSIWREYGPSAPLLSNLGAISAVTNLLREDYKTGYVAGRRLIEVGQGRGYDLEVAKAHTGFVPYAMSWFEPLEKVVEATRWAREQLLRGGEFLFGGYLYLSGIVALLDSAPNLDDCVAEIDQSLSFVERTGFIQLRNNFVSYQQFVRAMQGKTNGFGSFSDDEFDEKSFLDNPDLPSSLTSALFTYRAISALIFRDDEMLNFCIPPLMQIIPSICGRYNTAHTYFLHAVKLVRDLQSKSGDNSASREESLEQYRAWMAARAEDAPFNFGHLVTLIDAELAWAHDDFQSALKLFDRAQKEAEEHTRIWHYAFITEESARFHFKCGIDQTARLLMKKAADLYLSWGATAKVEQLQREFSFLSQNNVSRSNNRDISRSTSMVLSSESLDLMAIIEASQVLSSETNLAQLRDRLVEVLGAVVGATSVRLLLWNEDSKAWFLQSENSGGVISVEEASTRGLLALSVFHYVDRVQEPLLVADATRDDRFNHDPVIKPLESCSLMVVPVFWRGMRRAMLVLENRLSGNAFTSTRLDAVKLIAGQLAVSLENALAEQFRSMVQQSSDITLVCDRNAVVIYASAAIETTLGFSNKVLIGNKVTELFHFDDRDSLKVQVESNMQSEGAVLSCRALHVNGDVRQVEVGFTNLLTDPAVAGIVLHVRDVTEKTMFEAELRRAQKMESVGQLSAGVAHELNTPLQFISGNVEFVFDALNSSLQVIAAYEQAVTSSDIQSGITNARQLANTLDLDFLIDEIPSTVEQTLDGLKKVAKIVAAMRAFGDSMNETFKPSDLNSAIQNTITIVEGQVNEVADVVLELGELPLVDCNIGDINQVLLNLILNAVDAMRLVFNDTGTRGILTLRTRSDENVVTIEVVDSGHGVDPKISERIFEPFFTTKSVGAGTGQGLSLAYSLVHDRHKGSLSFTSQLGRGTTFVVQLPIA